MGRSNKPTDIKEKSSLKIYTLTPDKKVIQLNNIADFDDTVRHRWRSVCIKGVVVSTSFLVIPHEDISGKEFFFETATFKQHKHISDSDNWHDLDIIAYAEDYEDAMYKHKLAVQQLGGTLRDVFMKL